MWGQVMGSVIVENAHLAAIRNRKQHHGRVGRERQTLAGAGGLCRENLCCLFDVIELILMAREDCL